MNNRPLFYQGEEFEQPVFTPNMSLRGRPNPILEEDLEKIGGRSNQTNEVSAEKQRTCLKEIREGVCARP